MPKKVKRVKVRRGPPEPPAPSKRYSYAKLRPQTRINSDVIEAICGHVSVGHSINEIANFLCIDFRSVYAWKRKGEAYLLDPEANPKWKVYGQFVMGLRKASADYIMHNEARLNLARKDEWPCRFKILQARAPGSWGHSARIGVDEDLTPDESYL